MRYPAALTNNRALSLKLDSMCFATIPGCLHDVAEQTTKAVDPVQAPEVAFADGDRIVPARLGRILGRTDADPVREHGCKIRPERTRHMDEHVEVHASAAAFKNPKTGKRDSPPLQPSSGANPDPFSAALLFSADAPMVDRQKQVQRLSESVCPAGGRHQPIGLGACKILRTTGRTRHAGPGCDETGYQPWCLYK